MSEATDQLAILRAAIEERQERTVMTAARALLALLAETDEVLPGPKVVCPTLGRGGYLGPLLNEINKRVKS